MPVKPGSRPHKDGCRCPTCGRKKKAFTLPAGVIPGDPGLAPETPAPVPALREKTIDQQVIDGDVLEVPGTSVRARVGQWMLLRHQDPTISDQQVAEKMGIRVQSLKYYLRKAKREGWLTFSDPFSKIEHEVIPQVIDNLIYYLSEKGGRDKQITIEAAKGTIFKTWAESQGVSDAPKTVLALKIETAPIEGQSIKVVSGNVVGAPRAIEGIVIKESE